MYSFLILFIAIAAAEQNSIEITNTAESLEEALEAVGPLEEALQGMGQLENALQSLGPLEALQAIQPGPLHGMPLAQEFSMEYFSHSSNNQTPSNNVQCDRNLQSINPMTVLKRLHDHPELLDIVLETDPQKDLDSVLYHSLPPPVPHQQAQATQTQSHHHQHITQGNCSFFYNFHL